MNDTLICWKWDDETLSGSIEEKVEDLCSRFGGDTVFIAFHWAHRRFDDPLLLAKIGECSWELHKRGRKMCIEACIRNEGEGFFERYPEDVAYLAHFEELALDENGYGEMEVAVEPVYHYWRITGQCGAEKVYGVWMFDKADEEKALYKDGSLSRKDEAASLCFTETEGAGSLKITVNAGVQYAEKTAVICLGTQQPLPDLASPNLGEYYKYMLESAAHTNIDGVFSDEWGYDVILKITEVNPYDDNNLFLRHFSISRHFAAHYAKNFPGANLQDELIHLLYAAESDPQTRVAVINRYVKTLRGIMTANDLMMYHTAKSVLGPETFYGIHPTWWGSVDSLNFEIFKNGFYWWEAKRDIAQTDELVAMPIRTALARKWGSGIWYNMWYSLGSRDINTYYVESWHNLRYGGRTHHHGYECPNEAVVLELRQPGLLEGLEQMDSRIRMLDGVQTAQPDSRVMVLFGYEAVTNWALVGRPLPPWPPQNPKLDMVLNTANELFYKTLCDLVPTSEIENGSISVKNGMAVYNGHTYDAVVLLYPESMGKSCYDALRRLDSSRFIVCGTASMYSDGTPVDQVDGGILSAAAGIFEDVPSAAILAEKLSGLGVPTNRFANGCILTDGSAIFTADGKLPCGNPLVVNAVLDGKRIEFSGEDFLYIRPASDKPFVLYPGSGALSIDGIKFEK